ncbi:MAG: lipoprotein [Parvibaculum sp.]
MIRSILVLTLIAGLGLAACGKKGPPNLPQETQETEEPAT